MHIAIIMDGNRRWAKQKSLNTTAGHTEGAKTLENILEICPKYGINEVTTYALSTENFQGRGKLEIGFLMKLAESFATKQKDKFLKNGVRVNFLGDLDELPKSTAKALYDLEKDTENGSNLTLNICVNYGGRQEIVRAANEAMKNDGQITLETLKNNLQLSSEPELIIRTGGHHRFSNFLIWQGSYSELYFADILWPDFNEVEFQKALDFYKQQQRNFGK